jgi:hypothetical protein
MAFSVWFVNKTNALSYIMCTFGIKGKRCWIKNLVASAINVIINSTSLSINLGVLGGGGGRGQ